LDQAGRVAKMRHLMPRIVLQRRAVTAAITPNPHGKPPRSALTSVAKIFVWLLEEWYANLFMDKRGELLICDRYYHDLLIDPLRYRYGGPVWFARLVGKLIPHPQLWILLDAPVEVLQSRKLEVSLEECARQCQAYRDFVIKQRKYMIVDASQSLDNEIAEVARAVIEMKGKKNPMESV
jgi:thymidylate kinase